MDQSISFGGLLPLWILGAPLLAALFSLATTPKVSGGYQRDERVPRPSNPPMSAAGRSAARI